MKLQKKSAYIDQGNSALCIRLHIWLCLALNRQLTYLDDLLNIHPINIVTCKELIDELTEVSNRTKFRKLFTVAYVKEFISFHQSISQSYVLENIPNVVPDKKDNYLFALCEISNANYFVTGDKPLLEVNTYKQTDIITLARFKGMFN